VAVTAQEVVVASAGETYERLQQAWAQADAQAAAGLYAPDAVYYDSDNQMHRGADRIRDHLKGRFATRGPVRFTAKRQVEGDGAASGRHVVLTEWTSDFEEGGRRSVGLPGATVLEVGRDGIVYHRDYQ
jgi:ketosteroid isomerase-like protein